MAQPAHAPVYCAKCKRHWARRLWYVSIEKVARIGKDGKPDGHERVLRCRECRQMTAIPL